MTEAQRQAVEEALLGKRVKHGNLVGTVKIVQHDRIMVQSGHAMVWMEVDRLRA